MKLMDLGDSRRNKTEKIEVRELKTCCVSTVQFYHTSLSSQVGNTD